jgi:sporulation protein YlmC with PRC-barrel domain
MAERTEQQGLVRLSDTDFRLEAPEQDIRGLDVYDNEGNEIGDVKNLYVDEAERKVRFLNVSAGGFLGIGEKQFMLPVEAVTDVGEGRVTIEQGKKTVMESPPFDTDLVHPATDYQRDVYSYYGYPPYPWGV